jgi:hypothetical protein
MERRPSPCQLGLQVNLNVSQAAISVSQLPTSKPELVAFLANRCPSFLTFWQEVGPVYSADALADAAPSDALREFARHSLELYQEGRRTELQLIVRAVSNLLASQRARGLGVELLRMIESDWSAQMSDGHGAFLCHFPAP